VINEIAQLLSDNAVETAFPLDKPSIDDLVEAQEIMLISIPPIFRDYLMTCSHLSYGSLEPVTLADPGLHTYLPEVAARAWEIGLPRETLPLCQDQANVYCVGEDDTVYIWDQESGGEPEEVSTNTWEWVRDIWLQA